MRSVRTPIGWPVSAEMSRVLSPVAGDDAAGTGAKSDGRAPGEKPAGGSSRGLAFTVVAPLRTVSAANVREHWAVRARRVREERRVVTLALLSQAPRSRLTPTARAQMVAQGCVVTLTRLAGPRGRMLDDDNLRGCLKATRDAVAKWLGVDDADHRVRWEYEQRTGAFDWQVLIDVREVFA